MKRKIVMFTRGRREILLLLICLALIAMLFATGVLNRQKVWPDVPLEYRDGKMAFSVDAGDAYGAVGSGPYYDLPEGVYRLKWQLYGDGENAIVVSCSNGVEITPREIRTVPGEWQGEASFEIKGPAHNVSFGVEFREGTKLEIHNFRLYSPEYTDNSFTAAALILLCWLLYVMRDQLKDQKVREALTLLGAAVVFTSLPMLRENSLMAWDVQYHTLRILNLADGLAGGQFPVRCGGFSYNGYGAVTSVFYPDLLLYPLALLSLGGASLSYVVNVAGIAVNVLSAVTMYVGAKRLLSNHYAALCAAVLFVCSAFRLYIEYESFMLGWLLGMAFMPLFFAELWEVVRGDKERFVQLALYATLIFQSHLLSVVLCGCAAVGACMIFLPVIIREKRVLPLLKAIGLALLLNSFMLLPMAQYYMSGVNTPAVYFGFEDAALDVYEVFTPDGYVGLAILLGAAALMAAGRCKDEDQQAKVVAWAFLCGGALCMLLATKLIPWGHIVKLTGGLVEIIQFPWRVLALSAVFLSVAGGYGYIRFFEGRSSKVVLCVLALAIVAALPWTEHAFDKKGVLEFGRGANAYIITPEYQIEGTDVSATRSREVIVKGDVVLTEYEKKGTKITAQVDAAGDARLTMPLFGFDGYAAELNGERIDWVRAENNRLAVDIPAGTQGMLRIWFEGKAIWKVTDVLSLAAALCALGCWLKRKRRLH